MAQHDDDVEHLRAELEEARARHEHDRRTIDDLTRQVEDVRRESQHQIRNILSVVRSIARRTVADDESAEMYQARLDSRLASFTNLQGDILRDPMRGVDLYSLVDKELLAFGIKLGEQAQVEGPAVRLAARPAGIIGLAFHELARIAIESGASASLDGLIDVSWTVDPQAGEDGLEILWVETGRRSRGSPPQDGVFGQDVIEQAVAYEVSGTVDLDITADGLRCRFALPVACLQQPALRSGHAQLYASTGDPARGDP